jgi:hypothetical protein
MLPYEKEGCPGGEDIGHRLPKGSQCPTIHTGTPRRWGIRVPMSFTSLQRLVNYCVKMLFS